MHRVVIKRRDYRGVWIVETGPWLISEQDTVNWAKILKDLGYHTQIERLLGAAESSLKHNGEMTKK